MAFKLGHLKRLYSLAQSLGLGFRDTGSWLWSYYGARLSPQNHERHVQITLPNGNGKPVRVALRTNGFDWIVVEEVFVNGSYRANLDGVGRILDLGGNIGMATLFLSRQHPKAEICTVEPIPGNLAVLERNMKLNGVTTRVVAAAAGARDGATQFHVTIDPLQNTGVGTGLQSSPTQQTIDVKVISVPSLMQMMGWDAIDLLKIDIEGGEVEVLGGRPDWLRKVRYILGEGHLGAGYNAEACRRDLEPMGFKVDVTSQSAGAIAFTATRVN